MTLKEYLMDYAEADTRKIGDELIEKELENIPSDKVRNIVVERLGKIADGERDFRF
jgi:2-iminoacetate synthase